MSHDEPMTDGDLARLIQKFSDPMYGNIAFVAECRNLLATIEKLGQLYNKEPSVLLRENTIKNLQRLLDCTKSYRTELRK